MGLFGGNSDPDPAVLSALIQPDDKEARKAAGKKSDEIKKRVGECGGELRGVAYSFHDNILVITSHAFFDPMMKSVVKLADIRSAEVSQTDRIWWVTVDSSTQPRINYRVNNPGAAYRIQELLGFN